MPEVLAVSGATVSGALRRATARLAAAGCDTPRLDAEVLLAAVLGVGRQRLLVDSHDELNPSDAQRFDGLLLRRVAREPVAYIVGSREFRRISVCVDRRVLIPRPETELLVEVGLGLRACARVADVGTGSGAVALALKNERPDLLVTGTDVSAGAVEVARENAARLGLDVRFVCGDLLAGMECDAVLANLPYVEEGAVLQAEVSYEPDGALFAGEDGLAAIRRLVDEVPDAVRLTALEVAPHQARWLANELLGCGWDVEVLRDLAGHERVVVARR